MKQVNVKLIVKYFILNQYLPKLSVWKLAPLCDVMSLRQRPGGVEGLASGALSLPTPDKVRECLALYVYNPSP